MAVQISGNDITVPRDTTVTRNLTVGGVLTYEDVTNVDSVGLITARSGIEIGASPGVAASISVDGNAIFSGITTIGGALSGTTGTFSGALSGTTGTFTDNLDVATNIRHIGDTDTKISFDTNTIHFDTDNSERLRINSSGKILIGDDTAENTMGLNANVQTFGTDASTSGFAIKRGSNDAQGAFLVMSKSRNTSVGSRTILQNGDEVGNIFFVADDGTDLISNTAAIKSRIDTAPGADDTPGNLTLWTTADGANSATERLRIDNRGRVTTPYQVAFCASGDASNLDIDPGDKIAFNTLGGGGATINTNRTTYGGTNVFDTTNYQFTAPVDGLYLFTVSFYMRALNGSVSTQFILAINGTEVNHQNHMLLFSVYAVEGLQPNATQILDLSANDVVTVHRRTAGQSGTSRVYMPHSYFQGCLIG